VSGIETSGEHKSLQLQSGTVQEGARQRMQNIELILHSRMFTADRIESNRKGWPAARRGKKSLTLVTRGVKNVSSSPNHIMQGIT